jgi:predicted GNAT family acetyltransferase
VIVFRYSGSPPLSGHAGKIGHAVNIKKVNSQNVGQAIQFDPAHKVKAYEKWLKSPENQGYYAYFGSKCVHRSWVKKGPVRANIENCQKISLKSNEILIHSCETAPGFRGKGIYPRVLKKIIADFKDKEILIAVNALNKASIKGVIKAGFRGHRIYRVIVICGIKPCLTKKI